MGIVKEFRDFAMRGNVIDMAVGIVIGVAFGRIVTTLVERVIMPPIGMLLGGVDFADKRLLLQEGVEAADGVVAVPEVAIFYGEFINVVINFIIVAFAIFLVVKMMNAAKKKQENEEVAAPAPSEDVLLLREIRDALQHR
ncbi:MAG: large-conductance mechanosensitive channel protein MscL [Phycisphaeraceae bacterium]|nr:MAG: large-conductance mechanosensitive channel protein MscL [Phycisphaeraceae bacterium]